MLVRTLGVGGVATVFEATDAAGARVAVKVLHSGGTQFEQIRRFRREFLALQALNHPGVVGVLAVGREHEIPWMAMEYVDGPDLGETLRRWAEVPPKDRFERVLSLLRDLCDALGAVHAAGLIHRDIKLSNVLLSSGGRPKLIDFGLVSHMAAPPLHGGPLVGTFAFMAPEQVRGEEVDPRADLYALGVVLYALLTGELPIQAESAQGYLRAQVEQSPRPPSEIDPRIPLRLEQICLTLLEKDPARRFASARQVIAALDQGEHVPPRTLRGREVELNTILDRVKALGAGTGGVVVVTGEAGMGKSALLAELVRRARAQAHDVAFCSGDEPLLEHLALQLPELGVAREPSGDAAQRLVRRARGRPWVLVIDDLDRSEPEHRAALTALARDQIAVEGEALLLVVSALGVDGAAAPLATGAETGLVPLVLPLGPLDEDNVLLMLQDLGLGGSGALALAQRLAGSARGHPGAIVEQISALEEAGWLVREGSTLGATVGVKGLLDACS